MAVVLFAFDILRRKVPEVFEARRTLNTKRLNLDHFGRRVFTPPPPSRRNFGWVAPVLRLELDTVAVTHGLDAALFLRFLRTMAYLFLVLCIPTAILLPVYYTGANKNLEPDIDAFVEGIQSFSLSNLDSGDPWRFWIALAADYVVLGFVCMLLYKEFQVYANHRIRYRAADNPANFAIIVQDIPLESSSEEAVYAYWNTLFPGQVASVFLIHDGKKLNKKMKNFWTAVTKRERAEWDMEFNEKLAGERPTHGVGFCSCCRGASAKVDSIDYWTDQQSHYFAKISAYQKELDPEHCPCARAAIVVFNNRRAAAVAVQTNFSKSDMEWRVSHAPEPKAVNWSTFSISAAQVPVRQAITLISTVLLTLFWIIPVTFISGLTNLQELSEVEIKGDKPFSFLSGVPDWSPVLTGFIESTLPAIILSVFLSLIPTFLRILISVSRVPSTAEVDMRVRDYYFNFVVFSNFLFIITAGTLLKKLPKIIDRPKQIIDLLASSAPQQATFMMNFILLKALSETPKELLQLGRLVIRWAKLKFLARTPRERAQEETGKTEFYFFKYYAMAQLVSTLGLIYSTIAPFIIPICFLYFAIMYVTWKYNLCFSLHNSYENGGSMYGGALYSVWIGLFLHLLMMMGLFALNKNPAQSALILIPTVASFVFIIFIRHSFLRISAHGSATETHLHVEENEGVDKIPDCLLNKYVDPAFEPLPDPVENLNGVDGNTGEVNHTVEYDLEDPEGLPDVTMDTPQLKSGDARMDPPTSSTDDWKDANGAPPG